MERPFAESSSVVERKRVLAEVFHCLNVLNFTKEQEQEPLCREARAAVSVFFERVANDEWFRRYEDIDIERLCQTFSEVLDVSFGSLQAISLSDPPTKEGYDGTCADLMKVNVRVSFEILVQRRFFDQYAELVGDDRLEDDFQATQPLCEVLFKTLGRRLSEGDGLYKALPVDLGERYAGGGDPSDPLRQELDSLVFVVKACLAFAARGQRAETESLIRLLEAFKNGLPLGTWVGSRRSQPEVLLVVVA